MDKIKEILDDKVEKTNIEEISVKDEKKSRKNKKEKKNKTEKKKSKKSLILLILILILIGIGIFLYKQIPTILNKDIETSTVNISVNYKKNLLFNKYDTKVTFNDSEIGTISQGGETLQYSTELPNGTYVISFTSVKDSTNTTFSEITIQSNINYEYDLKAGWKGLRYKESIKDLVSEETLEEPSSAEETTPTEE